jgi:tetratricopeptide (TPR) repeat protein
MFDKARMHLKTAYTQDPTSEDLWQIWASLAIKDGSEDEMLETAQTGLKKLDPFAWDFMPVASELFIRCGKFDLAADCITKLKEKNISSKDVAFLEGLLAEANKQDHKAVICWCRAIQAGDNSIRTHLALAAALARIGDNQSAILQLRTLVIEQPQLFQGHLELAKMLAQTGNWAEAAEQALLAMQINPRNLQASLLNIQARLRLIEGNTTDIKEQLWEDMEKQLNALDARTQGNLQLKLLKSQLAIQRGEFTKAEKILANLTADKGSQVQLALARIDLLTAKGSIDKAISTLYTLREQFPQEVFVAKYLAALLYKHRSKGDCEKILKAAIQSAKSIKVKRELGLLLTLLYKDWDQDDQAYRLLSELSKELPSDILIKRQLLKCEQVKSNIEYAQEILNDIKAIEGEDGWQWRYEQANIWFAGKDFKNQYPGIIALLKQNLATNPSDQTSRVLLAATYEKAGELASAIGVYKEALNNSPDDIRIIIPTIAAMYKAEAYEQADEILNRAARQQMVHPELSKLELQSHLMHGRLSSAESILEDLTAKNPDNYTISLSLALLQIRQNKYEDAQELLTKLKTQDPNSLPVIAALVELNVKQKKNDEALALCNEMIKQLGNASAYILRGKTYVMLGQNELAAKDFDHATAIEPYNIQAWLFKSDFNQLMGRLEEALKDVQQTLSLNPENLQIQKRAIELLLSSREPEKLHQGMELLDKALDSSPRDTELRLYKAHSLIAKADTPSIEQAENILNTITEDHPKTVSAWVQKARIYLKQGQSGKLMDTVLSGLVHSPNDKALLSLKAQAEYDRSPLLAIPTLKMLADLYPDDTDVRLNLANTYVASERYDEGVTSLKQLLGSCKKSDKRKVNTALAVALYKSGNQPQAKREFELLYQAIPGDPTLFLTEMKLLMEDKQWSEMAAKVSERFEKQPDDTATFITLANELVPRVDSEARQAAEEILRRVLKKRPDSVQAMITLAMLLQMSSRCEESAALYHRIITLEPDNVIAINNLAWIMCEEEGEYEQALELAHRGLMRAPDYTDLIDTRGVVYYKLGQYDKAIQDFNRCLKLYPKNSPSLTVSYFHLGKALAKSGQKEDAIRILKKVLELNTQHSSLSATDVADVEHLLEALLREV